MMQEEEKKKKIVPTGANQWVQDARTISGGTSSQTGSSTGERRTEIDYDPDSEYFKPVNVDYTPEKFVYDPNSPNSLLKQMADFAKKPEFDAERAKRLERVAKLNAFGDLMKHLGNLAGGGYAPTEKRQENKGVLRAFQELNKMRDLYDERLDRYNNKREGWLLADLQAQRQAHAAEQAQKLQLAMDKANREQRVRDKLADIEIKRGTKDISSSNTTHEGRTSGWQRSEKNMLDRSGAGSGSSKNSVFTYRDTDGVFNLDKSRLTQFYSTLEKNRDKIKSMSPEDREKFGIGDNQAIDKDLEIMIAGLTGKISLNDANFQRITSKYMDAFRGSDMMKYILAGSFVPYEQKPDFVPQRTTPYETQQTVANPSSAGSGYDYSKLKF
ncbi:MAG: hypothetical protein NC410_08900 [Oscillibacter sp.]|nr:hypothetical protein [Oscillibacter sp.]